MSVYFRYFAIPLEKGGALHLSKLESPSPQNAFVPSLVEIVPLVLEEKILKIRQCMYFLYFVIISP